jgi:hypothetical protein
MSLERPSCQEEEDYIRQNYSNQAPWLNGSGGGGEDESDDDGGIYHAPEE